MRFTLSHHLPGLFEKKTSLVWNEHPTQKRMVSSSDASESFFQRISRIPLVRSWNRKASHVYCRMKTVHPLVERSSKYFKGITGSVISSVSPILSNIEPLANTGLDNLERNYPNMFSPPEKILRTVSEEVTTVTRNGLQRASHALEFINNSLWGEKSVSKVENSVYNSAPDNVENIDSGILSDTQDRIQTALTLIIELIKFIEKSQENHDVNVFYLSLTADEQSQIESSTTLEMKREKTVTYVLGKIKTDLEYVSHTLRNVLPGVLKSGYITAITICNDANKEFMNESVEDAGKVNFVTIQKLQSLQNFLIRAISWNKEASSTV
ncbi:hypothetical protein ACOME3_003419 [Neoechinorhynchus agilis]